MSDYGWVNPSNTNDLAIVDLDSKPLVIETVVRLPIDGGGEVRRFELAATPINEWDVYTLNRVDTPPALSATYYDRTTALAFSGTPKTPTGLVTETASYAPISLDALYNRKVDELTVQSNTVYFGAFQHDVASLEFWAESDQLSLFARASYGAYLGARGHDILYDAVQAGIDAGGGTNAEVAAFWAAIKASQQSPADEYWTRDIKVFLYDRATLQLVRDTANQNQWSGLMESWGTQSWQVRNAADRVRQDMDDAYGDGSGAPGGAEWTTLAAIVVDDATYNWPASYESPPAPPLGKK